MNRILLREFVELSYDQKLVKESLEKKEPIVLTTILQRAEAKNQNGRVYSRRILEREMQNYSTMIAQNRALGSLDHPDSSVVSLSTASHIITDWWWEGNDVMGKVRILNTPNGKIAQTLLEDGIKIGISSRGVGDIIKKEAMDVVDENFILIAFDLVQDPSTHRAILGGMNENKSISSEEYRKLIPKTERISRILGTLLE